MALLERGIISAGEREYIERCMELGPGCRSDGRSREMYRAITLQTGVLSQASGSAQLKIGQTDVIVAVKAEIGTPDEDRPDCGRLSFAVECSPVASPAFRGRGGDELSAELARTLERCTAAGPSGRGGGLDLAPLGIVAGKTCWVLHIDALVLNLDGNLLDALSVAVKAALADTRLPRVEVVAGEEPGDEPDYEVDDDPSASTPLEVGGLPIVVTISRVGRACAVDLTREEELCAGAALQVAVDAAGTVCGMTKRGGNAIDPSTLMEMVDVAQRLGPQLHAALGRFLAAQQQGQQGLHG